MIKASTLTPLTLLLLTPLTLLLLGCAPVAVIIPKDVVRPDAQLITPSQKNWLAQIIGEITQPVTAVTAIATTACESLEHIIMAWRSNAIQIGPNSTVTIDLPGITVKVETNDVSSVQTPRSE